MNNSLEFLQRRQYPDSHETHALAQFFANRLYWEEWYEYFRTIHWNYLALDSIGHRTRRMPRRPQIGTLKRIWLGKNAKSSNEILIVYNDWPHKLKCFFPKIFWLGRWAFFCHRVYVYVNIIVYKKWHWPQLSNLVRHRNIKKPNN